MGIDRGILTDTAHRPWPMPASPWIMTQTWNDLLFAHWPVDANLIRARVPAAFALDRFDGEVWLGVVPFHMTNVTARGVPPIPWLSAFPELNVRTYVTVGGKPGVYFFSLDAARLAAVAAARAALNLPYFAARMITESDVRQVRYASERRSRRRAVPARFQATFQGSGRPRPPAAGTLEHFLTERYCLYACGHHGRPYRLEIHHRAWPLEAAAADIEVNTMADAAGVPLPAMAPLLHFSRRQDMVCWRPQPVTGDVLC
jgi:hypothetical protein